MAIDHFRTMSWILALLAAPMAVAQGNGVYKCVERDAVAYQSTPCAAGMGETRMTFTAAPTRARADAPIAIPPPRGAPSRPSSRPLPWRNTTLTIGMSDDEVLNMPGWGRPARITRTRMPREWREEWVYTQSLAGEQRLLFANAKLVDVVNAPAGDHYAQWTSR